MSKLLITGVPTGQEHGVDGSPRIEITTFVQDEKQFSLYVQALRKMMYDTHHTERDSYYALASIHGYPLADWNGNAKPTNMFCVHRTDFFLPWHRPYVAIFEQVIQKHAVDIAAQYTTGDRLEWQKAAANIRQPYWGWEEYKTAVPPPEVLSKTHVDITIADGTTVNVENPLFSFKFQEGTTTAFPAPFNNMLETVRHYDDGASQPEDLRQRLATFAQSVHDGVKATFSLTQWREFTSGGRGSNGLESIHGTMHINTGGPIGHMRSQAVAAFDPIFWLHHSNVDRLTDLWYQQHDLWSPPKKDLMPFWTTQTKFWQPSAIPKTNTFNYSYHTIQTQQPVIGTVKTENGQVPATIVPLSTEDEVPGTLLGLAEATLPTKSIPAAALSAASTISLGVPEEDATMKDWCARIQCKPFEVGGSFAVYAFIGVVPADPKQWIADPGFAGSYEVFSNSNPETCANCVEQTDDLLHGYIHLNYTLISHQADEPSLDEDVVLPLVKNKLSWGVIKANREVVELSKFPSLEVSVAYSTLTLPVGAKFPIRSEPKHYHRVTCAFNTAQAQG